MSVSNSTRELSNSLPRKQKHHKDKLFDQLTNIQTLDTLIMTNGNCDTSTLYSILVDNNFTCYNIHTIQQVEHKHEHIIHKIIDKTTKSRKIYVFDIYKLPIEKKVSTFFQNATPTQLREYKDKSINDIIEVFNKTQLSNMTWYNPCNEIMSYYSIPQITSFDFKKGYGVTEKDNIVVIKLLSKDINRWHTILGDILGTKIKPSAKKKECSVASCKNYQRLYQYFMYVYRPPSDYIENVLVSDKEFIMYNTKEDKEEYISKWTSMSYASPIVYNRSINIEQYAAKEAIKTDISDPSNDIDHAQQISEKYLNDMMKVFVEMSHKTESYESIIIEKDETIKQLQKQVVKLKENIQSVFANTMSQISGLSEGI